MARVWTLGDATAFLTRMRDGRRFGTTDVLTYLYLFLGTILMFLPVVWLAFSSFKPLEALYDSTQTFLPYDIDRVVVAGFDEPLPLYSVIDDAGIERRMVSIGRQRSVLTLIDPADPTGVALERRLRDVVPVRVVRFAFENYTEAVQTFPFWTYLTNSVVVTVAATAVTLLFNSMAAFGLSKYRFAGRDAIFYLMLSTLLIPVSVILIPAFLVVSQIGWTNNLLGLIIPGAATPTGVFLLRQYMLSIPDELLDAARVDGANEWRIYWQIILPLTRPALAVLAIFSVMWRWNDFLWPLIVMTRSEFFTLPVGLNAFQGELNTQWNYILAITVLTLLPITVVFAFLQRFITTGIATTGIK